MMEKKVSVVLPTYNESGNIGELISQVHHYAGKDLLEVIVVDDNSPDGTGEIVKELQKKYKNLRLVKRINESGLPSAIWRGISEAKGNVIVWLDCDMSHPPEVIPRLLEHIPAYDIVCASRYVKGGKDTRSYIRVLASKIVNILADIILGLRIKDLTSGFYAVKKDIFTKVKLMRTGFAEYCIRFSYESVKKGFKFKEVGYISPDRKRGISKTDRNFNKFINDGYLCLREIIKLRLGK